MLAIQNCKPQNPLQALIDKYHEIVSVAGDLDDEKVQNYIRVVKSLREFGQNLPQTIAENKGDPKIGMDGYEKINQIIIQNGFKNYADFVRVNAKIAWAWNVSQGEIGIKNFQNLTDWGIEEIDKALNNPDVPEETKIELRKSRIEILENWEKNKKYAEFTLKIVKPLTNEKDLQIIKKYYKELMEAYTGIPADSFPKIPPM